MAKTATPATTPPAIAPALELLSSDVVGGADREPTGPATGAEMGIFVDSVVGAAILLEGDCVGNFTSIGDAVGKDDTGKLVAGEGVGGDGAVGVRGTEVNEKHPAVASVSQYSSVVIPALGRTCVLVESDPAGKVAD
jgi:hypothetical protein